MDRFIDEQDPSRDRSSSPNFYSLMFGGNEGRKGLSLYPSANAGKNQMHMGDSNGSVETPNPSIPQPSVQSLSTTNGRVSTNTANEENSNLNSSQQLQSNCQ